MRHLHAGKINYNATSMIYEDMMMMVMNAHIIYYNNAAIKRVEVQYCERISQNIVCHQNIRDAEHLREDLSMCAGSRLTRT